MKRVKIAYEDGNLTKILFGSLEAEDSIFVFIEAEDGTKFRINKSSIVTIKEL